jgi:putative hydrolase of the HAD superfamily
MPLALFDLDNTLIDRNGAFLRWVREFASSRGLPDDAVAWFVDNDGDGFVPRGTFFEAAVDRFGLGESVPHLCAEYRRRMPDLVTVRAEVLAGLAGLRSGGWRLGIVTNGDSESQGGKITRLGLGDYVDGWAISEAEGVRKPARALFAVAAARCGAPLDGDGWMVGDSRTADVGGGRAAGLRTIWIRGCGPQAGGDEPDHAVDDVLAAIALIAAGIRSGV